MTELVPYLPAIYIFGVLSLMMLVQVAVADVLGLKSGHKAGAPIPADQNNALFRAARALANTNETVSIFIMAVLFCIATGALPVAVNFLAALYLLGRLGHMLFYYLGIGRMRSISFGLSTLSILFLVLAGFTLG